MMSSPVPSIVICIAYVAVVKLGPTIMKNRKPMDLRNVLLVYNFFMVLMSTYCFMEVTDCFYALSFENGEEIK